MFTYAVVFAVNHSPTHSFIHALTHSLFVGSIRKHAYVHMHPHPTGFLGKWNLIVLLGAEITFDAWKKNLFCGNYDCATWNVGWHSTASEAFPMQIHHTQKSIAYALKYSIINQYSYNFNSLRLSCRVPFFPLSLFFLVNPLLNACMCTDTYNLIYDNLTQLNIEIL